MFRERRGEILLRFMYYGPPTLARRSDTMDRAKDFLGMFRTPNPALLVSASARAAYMGTWNDHHSMGAVRRVIRLDTVFEPTLTLCLILAVRTVERGGGAGSSLKIDPSRGVRGRNSGA